MNRRTIASVAIALLAAFVISGCVDANTETAEESVSDVRSKGDSCKIIATDLAEYTAELTRSANGRSDHSPSVMLSFTKGAVEKLTNASQKLEDGGVRSALIEVRDSSSQLVPVWEESVENPGTWTDGTLDADFAAANEDLRTALDELGNMCPGVTQASP